MFSFCTFSESYMFSVKKAISKTLLTNLTTGLHYNLGETEKRSENFEKLCEQNIKVSWFY